MIRFFLAACLFLAPLPVAATEAGWALLREGGYVVLLRHAMAPGTGDPANFDIDNCRTQRNLSDRGRQQARRIGALFAARAAPVERVLSSRWCRSLDTGRLAFGDGLVEPFPPLDPPRDNEEDLEERNAAVLEEIRSFSGSGNLVMVTDQENIRSLAGVAPREGEAVIVVPQGDGLSVAGRIVFN